ncbi:TonB family protein [Nannocystis bainbridge]|uniref:TonB family protein n=1 Tax=Nannocystis bainbridge TaxID=2995303 RepID=A0ABT5E5J3_9BACT|nr:TonB family protein [Nannocystis bainbridge]MDC0720624.1 TonB family protein [Nannocystis bainbridge]
MPRPRDNSGLTLVVFMLLASLLVHLVLWPLGNQLIELGWDTPPLPRSEGWMDVALVPPEEEPPPEAEAQPREPPKGRLIKQDRTSKEKAPDDAKYLSEFDQSTDKETRAPNVRPTPGGLPMLPGTAPDADNSPNKRRPQQAPSVREGLQPEGPQVDPGALGPMPLAPGGAAPGGNPGLRGTPGSMERALGQAGTMDSIDKNVPEGADNVLNSRRWKYASFFNRVRDAVAGHWEPGPLHERRASDSMKVGTKSWVTSLYIRLNPDGSIHKISIDRPAGLGYLDEEAIRAVRAAAPFGNPPAQLIDPRTGLIEFGFAFEFEQNGGQIQRYFH